MKRSIVLLALFCLIYFAQSALGQSPAEQESSRFIANAKLLEKKPFDPNAAVARESGFRWLIETDQVNVAVCGGMLKLIPEKKKKFKSELLMQQTFGMGVFKLENPDKKDDEKAAQLAGIESMLRAYEAIVQENEKAKNAEFDALLLKQKSGELKAAVNAAFDAGKCGSKSSN